MEFQAVVLAAGRGSQMTDLTSKIPKALLPIGNMPMLWYPINTLKQAGFEEAIVVVLDSYCAEAQKLLLQIHEVKMKLDFVSILDQAYMGTADTLCHIKDKIKKDMLIISCDLIIDISLHNIANIFRTCDATVTMLLCVIPEGMSDIPVPGPKSKKRLDNGANVKASFKDSTWIPCWGHNLNLVLSHTLRDNNAHGFTEVNVLIHLCKELATHVKRGRIQSELSTSVKQSVSTRWNSQQCSNQLPPSLQTSNVFQLNVRIKKLHSGFE